MLSPATPHEVDHLRDRVRLYLQVLLTIDLLAYVSDVVGPILFDTIGTPALPAAARILRWGVTLVLAGGWALTRFLRPGRAVLLGIETAVTIGLALVYVQLSLAFAFETVTYGPAFGLIGCLLLLVVRAALIPSSVWRTLALGVAALLGLAGVAHVEIMALDPTAREGLFFMGGAFVLATAVTSRVIYGLREQVREMTRLGQYTLEEKLGEGGMGVVYRARHGMLRRPTAIKLLPAEKSSAESLARFEREVQLTARLTHPNTVTVFDYGRTPDGILYYAMELLTGATLSEVVKIDGPQPFARVARILADCAGALEEAHGIGLIHRDVKPANVMLCAQGGKRDVAKLLDFGLVKELEREQDASLTAARVILGTPHYMSPEAITAPESVDARSDIYALGGVGYFLLTGAHPFAGTSAMEICAHHLHSAPVPPGERRGAPVPEALEEVILGCLAKSPSDRPASAAAIEERLRNLEGLGSWQPGEWWEEYAPAIEALHRSDETPRPNRTVAVDPFGRGDA